jgi:hypothetical protein
VNENGRFDSGELSSDPGVTAEPSASFTRHAVGVDARGGFAVVPGWQTTIYGELIIANNLDRAILPADPLGRSSGGYRELGYYAAFTQDLGNHATVGVRYDVYNPDRDSTNAVLGKSVPTELSYKTFAFAASLRARAGRLIFEYDLNRNHLGRDAAGFPANLKDNAFTVRGEARF